MNLTDALTQFKKSRLAVFQDDSTQGGRSVLVAPIRDISLKEVVRIISLSGGGLFFVAMPPERCEGFFLGPMRRPQTTSLYAQQDDREPVLAQCISVDAREGVTTGISASDRMVTLQILGAQSIAADKLVKPGHIFPVEVNPSGVLLRHALPEGALDLVRLIDGGDAALFVDLLDERGMYPDEGALKTLSVKEGIPWITLDALTRHRLNSEHLVSRVTEAELPTRLAGQMTSVMYRSTMHTGEHIALVKGTIDPDTPTLTRVQTEYTFSDVFGGKEPSSRNLIDRSLQAIGERGSGILLYLRQTRHGELHKQLHQASRPPVAAMMREYGLGAQILHDLGVRKIELLTNTKKNLVGLESFGIEIVSQLPIPEEAV